MNKEKPDFVIETLRLTRSYGSLKAVDRLDLKVPCSGIYGFLGPNGAGKTTTIRLLLGLIRPNSGDVRLFGKSLDQNRIDTLGRIGALVEMPSLYPHLTGRENLEITCRMRGEMKIRVEEALDMVRMRAASGRKVGGYSLGMKQRLGIAAALLGRPELLILDEPTNGLDPEGITEIRELIRNLPKRSKAAVFLSSHLLHEVEQVADHIGIIQEGRLRFQGPIGRLQEHRQARLELGVNEPDSALRFLAEKGWSAEKMGSGRLMVELKDQVDEEARINAALVNSGFRVNHLKLQKSSLEELFLKLIKNKEGEPV